MHELCTWKVYVMLHPYNANLKRNGQCGLRSCSWPKKQYLVGHWSQQCSGPGKVKGCWGEEIHCDPAVLQQMWEEEGVDVLQSTVMPVMHCSVSSPGLLTVCSCWACGVKFVPFHRVGIGGTAASSTGKCSCMLCGNVSVTMLRVSLRHALEGTALWTTARAAAPGSPTVSCMGCIVCC
jgi:hypothetical protein